MHCLSVTYPSHVAAARRLVTTLAQELHCDETATGRIALLATEVATNLVKHAIDGRFLVWKLADQRGLDLLALDKGPGMHNIQTCFRDGYSTAGSAGTGLGAITRLATFWDIYSTSRGGTAFFLRWLVSSAVSSQLRSQANLPQTASTVQVSGLSLPMPGEQVCGDAWAVLRQADRTLVMMADGLGHGPCAAAAAQAAVRVLHQRATATPVALFASLHQALQGTRGAAVALAEIHLERQELTFLGLGNIAGRLLYSDSSRELLSQNGIVGYQVRGLRPLMYPWTSDALLIMHSDGLLSRWSLQAYPGLHRRYPAVIAGVLYRDFCRGRDDVSVVAVNMQDGIL